MMFISIFMFVDEEAWSLGVILVYIGGSSTYICIIG